MMQQYQVEWIIEVDAETPEGAAREALKIQRDPTSIATVFEVYVRDENDRSDHAVEVDVQHADVEPTLPESVVEGIEHGLGVLAALTDGERVGKDDIYRAANALAATLGR